MSSRLERLERGFQSDAGKAGYKVTMLVIGVLVSVLMTIATTDLSSIRATTTKNAVTVSEQSRVNTTQDGDIKYLGRRMDALETTTHQQIETLQRISERVAVNTDKLEALKVSRTRPAK